MQKSVLSIRDLRVGQRVDGIVENHVQFGIFVNIGVEKSALAHCSTLRAIGLLPEASREVKRIVMEEDEMQVNARVKVEILKVELERQRIAVKLV